MRVGCRENFLRLHDIASASIRPSFIVANVEFDRGATTARVCDDSVAAELFCSTAEAKLAAANIKRTALRENVRGTPLRRITFCFGIAGTDAVFWGAEV